VPRGLELAAATAMALTGIHRLLELGQSTWLDYLDRRLLASGELDRLIAYGALRGVTSNPTIFQKAIASSDDYDAFFRNASPLESDARLLERLMVLDVGMACDRLRSVYETSAGADGFASIEVSPGLANNTAASIEEATRLWSQIDRPNLLVKIPGTAAGVPAIERCLAGGININITLLFSVERYLEVVEAYLRALEERVRAGHPIDRMASVASFFVSRVDTKVDRALDAIPNALRGSAGALRGQIAIANAKRAYGEFQRIMASERWKRLAARGARPQRLLWASTSPKDPAYHELYYVEALIGPDTIDTMTPDCFHAMADHGRAEVRLSADRAEAERQLEELGALGIDLGRVSLELEREGVVAFSESYAKALKSIADKRASTSVGGVAHARA
jgi:transaldolase